jgi:hypothetical protein
MLLENTDSPDGSSWIAPLSTTAGPTPAVVDNPGGASIHDDVERLIQIAMQLFSAIERQIHNIEVDLMFARSEVTTLSSVTVFKEQLIRSATNLDTSLQEIARHLGERATAHTEHARGHRNVMLD